MQKSYYFINCTQHQLVKWKLQLPQLGCSYVFSLLTISELFIYLFIQCRVALSVRMVVYKVQEDKVLFHGACSGSAEGKCTSVRAGSRVTVGHRDSAVVERLGFEEVFGRCENVIPSSSKTASC